MTDSIKHKQTQNDLSIRKLIMTIKQLWHYLLSKWKIIVICGFSGALVGLGLSFIVKPKYNASLSFALIEKGSSGSSLINLASSFGFGGLLGGGGDAFSGDNLLEIIKSRHTIEKTLLSPHVYHGKEMSLADAYLKFNKLEHALRKKNQYVSQDYFFPLEQDRETYTRFQDSILNKIFDDFIKNKKLTVLRKEKKISMVYVNFTSINEEFSKCFVENLINRTIQFYTETRTAQSRSNIYMMQQTADSVKALYDEALYSVASIPQININRVMQTAGVPRIQQENNVQLYGTVYAEVLKNVETLKLDLARETPIIQIIDTPRYPLKKIKLGKAKGIVYGGFIGGVLIVSYLLVMRRLRDMGVVYEQSFPTES